jgi:protein-S-isoprenylcysteine O-methyltransferase Ste14
MPVNVKVVVGQFAGLFLIFALTLFLPAGTLAWLAGWIFLGMFFGIYPVITAWPFKHNPTLLQERMRLASSDQQDWDKVLFPLILFFAWLALMAFDTARFHWSLVPVWLQAVGLMVLLCSFYLLFLTFRENSYLSPVVCIQAERGQVVVATGPYHVARHPMYAAIAVFTVGTVLSLGSWYVVLFGLILVVILARRAVLEERTLREALPGYGAYMTPVRYRLIPFVW